MDSADFPDWNAQLAHADGTGAFFCSSGDMLAYVFAPDHAGANDATVVSHWVTDVETTDWLAVEDAVFVLEDDPDEQQRGEPMGVNPRPFGNLEAAERYIEERAWLGGESIVTFDEIDYDMAHQYNIGRIPLPGGS